jgi:acetyl esterase/lipase
MNILSNKYSYFLSLFLLILTVSSCTTADENTQTLDTIPAAQFLNETYGTNLNQNYDIYLPANRTTSTPVIVTLHGGLWSIGDKDEMRDFVISAQAKNADFAIINTNYSLPTVGANQFPKQLDDIDALLASVASRSTEFQISQSYYFMGVSAGGNLALMYAYTRNANNSVKAVVNVSGPTNLIDPAYTSSINPEIQDIAAIVLGDTYVNNASLYQNASPLTFVNINTPPTAQFFGGLDNLVPISQGVDLKAALDALGITNEYTLYNNESHEWIGSNLTDTENKIANFFNGLK